MSDLTGITLGHYQVGRRLARGGMSEVYLATDEHTQSTVALKVVDRADEDHARRFRREIKAVSLLAHGHILPTLDYGEQDEWCFAVMPYIHRGTLRTRLAQGPLSLEAAGCILQQVASALQYAHEHAILHRDIKPSNILLADDQYALLADFGLARTPDENSITQAGCLIGTPEYMAPELAEQPASPRSDVYALGIVLYQMLTGQVPFTGSTPVAICWKHIQEPPTPPSQLNPNITYPIEQVVLHALEKNPARRFPTPAALAHAYQAALHRVHSADTAPLISSPDVSVRVLPVSRVRIGQKSVPRHANPLIAAVIVAAAFFAMPLSFLLAQYNDHTHLTSHTLSASARFAAAGTVLQNKPLLPPQTRTSASNNAGPAPQAASPRSPRLHEANAGERHKGRNGHGEHGEHHGRWEE